jgi:dihydrofolate synthase/folylpolyglutamate synthase
MVSGTTGKGSVSHFFLPFCRLQLKNRPYTSPHLVDFGERMSVNGEILINNLLDFVENHKKLIEEVQPSFFENYMSMAFDYFASNEVMLQFIEVGL